MDNATEQAARLFLQRVRQHYDLAVALLYRSQANRDAGRERDADIGRDCVPLAASPDDRHRRMPGSGGYSFGSAEAL